MFTGLKKRIIDFYTKEKEFDVRLFKLLGTAGVLVSILGAAFSNSQGRLINLIAALASVCLMWFVHATGKYLIGYLITTVVVFMGLFTWLFLVMGGINGAIPYFFAFGIVFTLLMYKGVLQLVMEIIQIAYYVLVCVFSYNHPELVKAFENPWDQFFGQIIGIVFSSVGIGLIFIRYIREYRKQQNIAEDSSKAKSILLANISHEVRTPINMLLGMNEMILRESENSEITEYAQNVDNAGQHLLFMVNQFLDLSRIDMGKEVLFEENFNVKKMIESLGAFFGKEAEKKNLEFVMDIDKKLPAILYGDNRKITQILTNLLSNAVKYTDKGNIVFSVSVEEQENTGEDKVHLLGKRQSGDENDIRIRFEVSDTGNGIPEEAKERIFESFERADLIKNRSVEGTGLGLAISNKLANLMGTKIQVESTYGVGSAFWFVIDLKACTDDVTVQTEPEGYFIAPEARLLVVDDNSMNLQVAKALLKRTLVGVDTANSALECYDKFDENDYNLVLMDYMMPDIDGVEAMQHLKEMDKEKGKSTPIIVLTADASPDKKDMFMAKGFDDYLLKPVEAGLLENVLMKHLPERLVTRVNYDEPAKLPEDVKRELTRLLKDYDISLDGALKHLGGDVLQFARVSEYFLKNTPISIEKIKAYVEKGDYENAAILIHAIKGNAGNVGGEDLYYSARRLEKRAKDGDAKYLISALPLFTMKWERVVEGLESFLKEFEKIRPDLVPEEDSEEITLNEKEAWDALLSAVRLGDQSSALKMVDRLETLHAEKEKLETIRTHIKNIEFDEAESLLNFGG